MAQGKSTKIKISKEELKHDEVLETADKWLHWFKDNMYVIIFVLAGVLFAYGIGGFLTSKQQAALMEVNDQLAQALGTYESAIQQYPWASAERVSAMEEVAQICDQIIAEREGEAIARQALFLKGNAFFKAGDQVAEALEGGAQNTTRAINIFTELASLAKSPLEAGKAKLGLAYGHENKYFLENDAQAKLDAEQLYNEIIEDDTIPAFIRAEAHLALGRIAAFNDDFELAETHFRTVMEMRYAPIEAVPADAPESERLMQRLYEVTRQFSLAGTARLELSRLGIDVETEYPLAVEPDEMAQDEGI